MTDEYMRPQITRSMTTPSIVGRQHELTLAMDHYEAAKAGYASVMLLTGEPGIGKTRSTHYPY